MVGCLLMTLLKNCDRVKMACLAQLVNVIAPIMTENADEGCAWAQTIFYPFMHASSYGRGIVLDGRLDCPTYDDPRRRIARRRDLSGAVGDGSITIFAVNRSGQSEAVLECDLGAFGITRAVEHIVMAGHPMDAVNTADNPMNVVPESCGSAAVKNGVLSAALPADLECHPGGGVNRHEEKQNNIADMRRACAVGTGLLRR